MMLIDWHRSINQRSGQGVRIKWSVNNTERLLSSLRLGFLFVIKQARMSLLMLRKALKSPSRN